MSNQAVLAVQNALGALPALSAADQFSNPLRSVEYGLRSRVLERTQREIETIAGLGQADLAVFQVRDDDRRHFNKSLFPAWCCLFRYESDPRDFRRLLPGRGASSPLSLPSFSLISRVRPGVIAVHQPVPTAQEPCTRLFLRLAGFLESREGDLILGSDYFETRLMQDEDDEPYHTLEILSGAALLFGRQREQLMDDLKERPLKDLRLPVRILRKIRNFTSIRTIGELAAASLRVINEGIPKREARLSRADGIILQEALGKYGLRFREGIT